MSSASSPRQRARLDLILNETSSNIRQHQTTTSQDEQERSRRRRKVARKLSLRIAQESSLLDGQRATRKIFFEAQPKNSRGQADMLAGQESRASPTPIGKLHAPIELGEGEFRIRDRSQTSFLGRELSMWIGERLKPDANSNDKLAIRIRTGSAGYSEWMNELQVYLLPNFKHVHILPQFKPNWSRVPVTTSAGEQQQHQIPEETQENMTGEDSRSRAGPAKLEYWLVNSFHQCVLLRDFLRLSTLSWSQMICVSLGILKGVHFLHENTDYQNFNQQRMMENFIRSTDGAIKKLAFTEGRTAIHMKPNVNLSVIHRNLSSLSIVLRGPQLIPCIWNFGLAYIQHPFQPVNHQHLIDREVKEMHMQSQYSAPEVLEERSHLTLQALKAIDLYACGIILWELMTRCELPRLLDEASFEEHQARSIPEEYHEPFERELGKDASQEMLVHAVCRIKARPRLKSCWLIGKKTVKFVGCMKNLWDQDYDARIHTGTAIDRLERLSLSDRDLRYKYPFKPDHEFDVATMWPPELKGTQAPPFPDKCGPNLVVEELSEVDEQQGSRSSGAMTSHQRRAEDLARRVSQHHDESDDDADQADENHFFQLLPKINHDSLRPYSAPVLHQQTHHQGDLSSSRLGSHSAPQAKSASPSFGRLGLSLRSRLSRSFLFRPTVSSGGGGGGGGLQGQRCRQQQQSTEKGSDQAIEVHESMSFADRELSDDQDGFEVIELDGDKSFSGLGQAHLAAGSSTPKQNN